MLSKHTSEPEDYLPVHERRRTYIPKVERSHISNELCFRLVKVRRAFILDLTAQERVASDLSVGGVFVPDATVDLDDECRIILRAGDEDVTVDARVVQITETGAGFQIEGMTDELRQRILALIELAKHVDLERKKTEAIRRAAAGSIPPVSRRGGRIAEGSISPIVVVPKDDTESDG